jgi:hypothetical protein
MNNSMYVVQAGYFPVALLHPTHRTHISQKTRDMGHPLFLNPEESWSLRSLFRVLLKGCPPPVTVRGTVMFD